jgi:hypothetical protein
LITIEDIRNPDRVSGFNNVTSNGLRTNWRASSGNTTTAGGRTPGWRGPTRKTPEAAAQDYVDFVNLTTGKIQVRALHPRRRTIQIRRQRELSPAEQVAKDIVRDARGWRRGQEGFIYLVAEHEIVVPGDFVKIGGTVADPPEQRLGDYQVGNPRRLYMVAKRSGTYADEQELHRIYAAERKVGEWFTATVDMLADFGIGDYV